MRVEGDDGRLRPGLEDGLDHAPVPEVDAVEGAEGHCPRPWAELRGRTRDLQASRPNASSGGMIRFGSASATSNGPTWVLRSVTQWPPRASATDRTYAPELRSIESSASGSSYFSSSSS